MIAYRIAIRVKPRTELASTHIQVQLTVPVQQFAMVKLRTTFC